MNLHDEFLSAAKAGEPYDRLREIVERFKSGGGDQREAYKILERIYGELGCHDDRYDEDPEFCDRIGDVLDGVWGWRLNIWPTNLGDQEL